MTLDMFSRQQQEKTHIIAEYYLNFSFYNNFDNFGIFQEIRNHVSSRGCTGADDIFEIF